MLEYLSIKAGILTPPLLLWWEQSLDPEIQEAQRALIQSSFEHLFWFISRGKLKAQVICQGVQTG